MIKEAVGGAFYLVASLIKTVFIWLLFPAIVLGVGYLVIH